MDKLVSLCKRRGFVFQSSEIYGGLGSVWDYGPLGVELKRNLKDRWWQAMVHARDDIEGLDAAILMHPKVWEASGTWPASPTRWWTAAMQEPLPRRPDQGARPVPRKPSKHPRASTKGDAHRAAPVQPDVQDVHGAGGGQAAVVYLRPETAQGIYVNYLNVQQARARRSRSGSRRSARRSATRSPRATSSSGRREFEQMEMQFFVKPGTDAEWFERWRAWRMEWHHELGLGPAAALAPARRRRAGALRPRGLRHRVRVPVRLAGDREGSTTAATSTSAGTRSTRARSWSTSTRRPTSATCRTSSRPRSAPTA